MIISKPKPTEYAEFAQKYLNYLPDDINLTDHFIQNLNSVLSLIDSIPENKLLYRYETDKWTVKEVLLHIIDVERIFAYRALVYARKDKTVLPPFSENDYAKNSYANKRNIIDIIDELKTVRLATISLFKSFTQDQFLIVGKTLETNLSVSALAFLILGHCIHYINILKEKYLKE